jgi:SNF2 family DNA or RNA helicase
MRSYQKPAAAFLALRDYAMLCDPPRAGKCLPTLAASVLVDARRTLIVCPALPKLGWAEEVAKWVGEEAVILEGRAGKVARKFCMACRGRGFTVDPAAATPLRCEHCKKKNGQSDGWKLVNATYGTCSAHGHTCPACEQELYDLIDQAKYVIVNYDLLAAQKARDGAGREYFRADLPGWVPALSQFEFDLCILDEAHNVRGWSSAQKARGQSRRERVNRLTEMVPRVWGVTATPMFGFVRDYWGQLDTISKGAVSGNDARTPFNFHVRYCEGEKGEYGWRADGRTAFAETELVQRMKYFMLRRERDEILKDMPPKPRHVVRIEGDTKSTKVKRALRARKAQTGRQSRADTAKTLMVLAAEIKTPHVVEAVMEDLSAGAKVMVVAVNPDSVRMLAKALEKECRKKSNAPRMRAVNVKIWEAHGEGISAAARAKMAKRFSQHTGAGAICLSIDAWRQGGVSLEGVTAEHWIDLHHDPAANLQVEDRAYIPGITKGLSISYYVLKGSYDEHREARILPKIESLARMQQDVDAATLRAAFQRETDASAQTLVDTINDLCAHIDEEYWEDA